MFDNLPTMPPLDTPKMAGLIALSALAVLVGLRMVLGDVSIKIG